MNAPDLLATLDSLGHPRVLVIGDFMLDLYTWGDAERISQEAPVILLRADRRERRLGGAANVCQLLRGLEAKVTCAGIVGNDQPGQDVRRMLANCDVEVEMLLEDSGRPTTTKERFIGRAAGRHPHQMLRVDSENCDALEAELELLLLEKIRARVVEFDIVLISDYGKGVCTPTLLQATIEAARGAGVPVIVDPIKRQDYSIYRGATAVTPNRNETEFASGQKISKPSHAFAIGQKFCREADLEMAIITLDSDGMALVQRDGDNEIIATRPRAVYDITGAGDMVLATLGLALAGGARPKDAVRLGNLAGGLEVEQFGVAVISRDELRSHLQAELQPAADKVLDRERLVKRILTCRERGQRVVFTNGCFDLLHVGHITYLHQAAALGDVLVIGVNSDASVRAIKGTRRPVIGQHERATLLAAMACVDVVTIFDEQTPEDLIRAIRPDVLVKGGDYLRQEIVGGDFVESYGGSVVIVPMVEGVSTTEIVKRIAA